MAPLGGGDAPCVLAYFIKSPGRRTNHLMPTTPPKATANNPTVLPLSGADTGVQCPVGSPKPSYKWPTPGGALRLLSPSKLSKGLVAMLFPWMVKYHALAPRTPDDTIVLFDGVNGMSVGTPLWGARASNRFQLTITSPLNVTVLPSSAVLPSVAVNIYVPFGTKGTAWASGAAHRATIVMISIS